MQATAPAGLADASHRPQQQQKRKQKRRLTALTISLHTQMSFLTHLDHNLQSTEDGEQKSTICYRVILIEPAAYCMSKSLKRKPIINVISAGNFQLPENSWPIYPLILFMLEIRHHNNAIALANECRCTARITELTKGKYSSL